MPYSTVDWEAKLDHTLRTRYAVALMNDTKWREVWAIVCDLRLRVQMDYADSPGWAGSQSLWGPFRKEMIEERGIRDPGIGGPFLFKQTLWLRIPKVWPNDTSAFKAAVSSLGAVPLVETDELVEVRGYEPAAG